MTKKSQQPPAFQLYARDWIEETADLSLEEQGAVTRLYNHQWVRGGLPNDRERLARLLGGVSEAKLTQLWPVIERFFPEKGDTRAAPWMEEQRRALDEYHQERAASGRRGAEKRWNSPPSAEPMASPLAEPLANAVALDGTASAFASASALEANTQAQTSPPPNGEGPVPSSTAVEVRSKLVPDTTTVEAQTQRRVTRETGFHLAAEMIFAYWKARMGKNKNVVVIFDKKRESQIIARLRDNRADVTELLYAVDGALLDDFLMGRDPKTNGQAHNGIETIFRDRSQVERLRDLVPGKQREHPFLAQQKEVT